MSKILNRKITKFLEEWKESKDRLPLIIKGARQIGKTTSILEFAKQNYKNVVVINFIKQPLMKDIFDNGYQIDDIVKTITFHDKDAIFESKNTLIFFDEMQVCPNCATSLKFFKLDGRYDVICSESMMGLNYKEIESNSVGFKFDYEMHPMDFEEFLWAKGYSDKHIEDMLQHMINLKPFSNNILHVLMKEFQEYMIVGGMPKIVSIFVETNKFTNIAEYQKQILIDYVEDITKYAIGLEKGKILNTYNKIPYFLGKENKRFYITKVTKNARAREYIGAIEWLKFSGIINICYCLDQVALPLVGNSNPSLYKVYYMDVGLLVTSLDEESKQDLFERNNFNTFKGALYENAIANELIAQKYLLHYYKNEKSTLEIDFFVRDKESLVPIEIKPGTNKSLSLKKIMNSDKYKDIKYGIKFANANIGFADGYYTFPYFCIFLLRRYLKTK